VTATTDTHPDCRCGHDRASHFEDGFAPQCTAARCTCLRYQPPTDKPATVRTSTDNGTSIDQLIAAGRLSTNKRIAALAAELDRRANRLRVLLDEQRINADMHREIARLERELAAAKARLRGTPAHPQPPATSEHACPDCIQTFATLQGLGAHRARKHGYRRTG
jgi:hypothetical protein